MTVSRDTVRQVHRLRRQVGGEADKAVAALNKRWTREWSNLRRRWAPASDAVANQVVELRRWPQPWELAANPDLRRALDATDVALSDLQRRTEKSLTETATKVVGVVLAAEALILASQWPTLPAAAALFTARLPARAAELAAAMVTARVPVATGALAADAFSDLQRLVVRGVPVGGPQAVARDLTTVAGTVFDASRRRAASIVRTETMDAHRQASHAFRVANLESLTGWVWVSALSRNTCAACWAMHGTVFPGAAEVGPLGHVNCRCVPMSLRFGDDLGALPDARARFDSLPEADQTAILGPTRLALLRAGRVGWDDMAVRRSNRGWRTSYAPRTVADLQRLARSRRM